MIVLTVRDPCSESVVLYGEGSNGNTVSLKVVIKSIRSRHYVNKVPPEALFHG